MTSHLSKQEEPAPLSSTTVNRRESFCEKIPEEEEIDHGSIKYADQPQGNNNGNCEYNDDEVSYVLPNKYDDDDDDDCWAGVDALNNSYASSGTNVTNVTSTKTNTSSDHDDMDLSLNGIGASTKHSAAWIRIWRRLTMCLLLGTACAVTLTTYRFLRDEQTETFHEAVRINHPNKKNSL